MSNKSKVVRTALAGLIQTGQHLRKFVQPLPNSTLNQKLDILADQDIAVGTQTAVEYIAIGNGGHDFVEVAGRKKWVARKHEPTDTALFNQLPFILRPLANDLTVGQRTKYRLRRVETHGGASYAAYYLRKLDLTDVEVSLELRHVDGGVTTSSPYVPTIENINPVPSSLITGEPVTTSGDYIAATAQVPFVMTTDEIAEFVSACSIIYGEEGFSEISEIATVAAQDVLTTGQFSGGNQQYTDVLRAQITSFIPTAFVTEYLSDSLTLNLDIGTVEPISPA